MASCQTSQWGTASPYVKLTVTEKSSTGGAYTLSWKLQYIAAYAAQTNGAGRAYSVVIDGTTVKSGTYNINGVTGTHTIAEGTKTVSKGTSDKSVSFKCSFAFNISWSGIHKDTLEASGSIAVKAKTSYAVSYNANGGSGTPSSQTKWYDTALTLSTTKPTRTGYSFQGWGTSASATTVSYDSGAKYTKNAAITLYAIWKANTYTVSYNANGGSGAPSSQTKTHGKDLTLSTTKPTRTGYSFQGWGTSASATTVSYASGAKYTANSKITLYAVWKANTYTITYNVNGGSGNITSTTKTHGVSATLTSSKPTRINYSFLGWSESKTATSATYASGASYTKNNNVTLYAVWKLTYVKPKITGFSAKRCDADKTLNESGKYALVKFSWSTSQNVDKLLVEWLHNSTVIGSTTVAGNGKTGSVDIAVGNETLETDITYVIRITVTDSGGSTTLTQTLNGIRFPMDFKAGGKGVAFGKVADVDGYADFGFKTWHRDNSLYDNGKRIYGRKTIEKKDNSGKVIGSEVVDVEAFMPINANGNTIIGYGNYSYGVGDTNIYGHDINITISNVTNGVNNSSKSFRPYFRKGDQITITIDTAGYVTDGGQSIYFTIPLSKPIIGSPTITITSGNGLRLRQNGYTHGSGSDTWVHPSKYSNSTGSEKSAYYTAYGIRVIAMMGSTTNVTNNGPIGIRWHGTITFS